MPVRRPVVASTFAVVRSRCGGAIAVGAIAAFGLAACGITSMSSPPSDATVVATDFATYPPPTTTLPPTTTTPPEPGTVLATESEYVVESGDYPFVVADRFQVDFEAMVELNGWTIENGVVPEWPDPGTTIRIPAGATVPEGPSVLVPVGTAPPDTGTTTAGTGDSETSSTVDDGIGCGTYTIVEGDYLGRVATKLRTTVEALDAANEDTDGYAAFYVGLKINVPC